VLASAHVSVCSSPLHIHNGDPLIETLEEPRCCAVLCECTNICTHRAARPSGLAYPTVTCGVPISIPASCGLPNQQSSYRSWLQCCAIPCAWQIGSHTATTELTA
jgi:hypothetical protein